MKGKTKTFTELLTHLNSQSKSRKDHWDCYDYQDYYVRSNPGLKPRSRVERQ